MSNKAKKAKQQSLRKQEQTKRLNRVRGMVKNFNLTDAEAEFYYRALNSKETPIEFLLATHAGIKNIITQFDLITGVASDSELMEGMAVHYKDLHSKVSSANEFITSCDEDTDKVLNDNREAFEALGTSTMDIISCGGAIEGYGNIQDSLAHNAASLMGVVHELITMYAEIEANIANEEANNTATFYSVNGVKVKPEESV